MRGQQAADLSPQNAYVRRLQHLLAQRYNLTSRSLGQEPQRRVRILPAGSGGHE
jgi:predicted RNA-binding protein Jag